MNRAHAFFMPRRRSRRGILFPPCPSVCLWVRLHIGTYGVPGTKDLGLNKGLISLWGTEAVPHKVFTKWIFGFYSKTRNFQGGFQIRKVKCFIIREFHPRKLTWVKMGAY